MINREEIYELVIEDENIDGIFAISLVQDPAIEADFVYFDKEKVLFSSVDNEQRLVMGAILIPNKKILRIDGEGKTYHVFFKPETIKRLSEMYLKNKYTDKATLEHNQKINGVTLVESWIKESASKDKSALYNLNAPVGSWIGTFKIDNDMIWNDYVKTGDVKGFSIEGLFGHSLVSANEIFNYEKDISLFSNVEAEILLEKIKEILEGQPSVSSTYPGQAASGSIAPALLAGECPEATQNIEVNLKGRQNAIDTANYGPLNPNEANEGYWKAKADMFKGDLESAKKALCGNCSFFVQTKQILDCIAGGINDTNEWDTIEAGDLGYCEAFDFKCAANRTCDAWVSGGPIVE
jgi:hypothetical protein